MNKNTLLFSLFLLVCINTQAQNLRSLRNKLENAIVDEVVDEMFDKDEDNSKSNNPPANNLSESNSNRPEQKSGSGGLDNSLANVPDALDKASDDFNSSNYNSARASLRSALKTLDIKIGNELIASLPENVNGLSVNSDADLVVSGSSGWAGLSVRREYQKNDNWTSITIYNNSMAGVAHAAIAAGMYSAYAEEDENQKSIQVKDYDAVITFSDSEGYAISISIAQQTFVLIEGVNISSEAEMIAIAETYNYNTIKEILGDQ